MAVHTCFYELSHVVAQAHVSSFIETYVFSAFMPLSPLLVGSRPISTIHHNVTTDREQWRPLLPYALTFVCPHSSSDATFISPFVGFDMFYKHVFGYETSLNGTIPSQLFGMSPFHLLFGWDWMGSSQFLVWLGVQRDGTNHSFNIVNALLQD